MIIIDHYLSLNIAHFIGNVLLIHLPDVLVPVIATGNSSSPFRVFMRILSTVVHILSWYDEDPFDKNTKTYKSMLTVRRNCHMAVSQLMNKKYPRPSKYWLNQFDMAMTQWSLIGIVAIRPQQCAFYGTTEQEFEEYFYFWRVIGYCVGIEDRFNICYDLDYYDETVAYLDICFKRCYKIHLDEQSPAVLKGMELTQGVFLALEGATPRFLVCYETFMKYWYDTLGVRHPIKLNTIKLKLYYCLFLFINDYLLKIRLFYTIISWLFFYFLKRLFLKIDNVKTYCEQNYSHLHYQLDSEYFDNIDREELIEKDFVPIDNHFDDNNNYELEEITENTIAELEINDEPIEETNKENDGQSNKCYYQINNYFYRPNIPS